MKTNILKIAFLVLSCGLFLQANGQCTTPAVSPNVQINGGSWVATTVPTCAAGSKVWFGPNPGWLAGTWSWSGPNEFTASGRSLILTDVQPDQSGDYLVIFVNEFGCASELTFTLTVTGTGTSVISQSSAIIDIFPNPAIDFINVNNAKGADISIFDSLGKVVLKSNCADNLTRVDVTGLFNGFYMIQVQMGKDIVTQKLIITK